MSDSNSYLAYLLNEDLYVIDKGKSVATTEKQKPDRTRDISNVLVLVQSSPSSEAQQFLQKVLQSVRLSLEDISLVDQTELNKEEKSDITSLGFRQLLAFGPDPGLLPVDNPYQVQEVEDKSYLMADRIETIMNDQALKRKLWDALRLMFQVSD